MMERVGLLPQRLEGDPHELSGRRVQRAAICRALLLSPSLLVADEAVSKLDVSVRAQILNLLEASQRDLSLSVLFITHDLRVARYLCDRIAVMYFGRLVELGPTRGVFEHPRHPYTRALLGSAVLRSRPRNYGDQRRRRGHGLRLLWCLSHADAAVPHRPAGPEDLAEWR